MSSPGGVETGRASVRVVPDTSGFANDLRRDLARINANLEVQVTANLDRMRQQIQAGVRQASAGVRAHVEVVFFPAVAVLRARLEALARAAAAGVRVRIDVDVDGGSLSRALRSLTSSSGGGGPGRLVASFAKLGAAISAAGIAALTAHGALGGLTIAVAAIGTAVAQTAGIAAVLPAAIGALGVAYATLKVGMSGVSDALSGDAEAMARLAPAAQQARQAPDALHPHEAQHQQHQKDVCQRQDCRHQSEF